MEIYCLASLLFLIYSAPVHAQQGCASKKIPCSVNSSEQQGFGPLGPHELVLIKTPSSAGIQKSTIQELQQKESESTVKNVDPINKANSFLVPTPKINGPVLVPGVDEPKGKQNNKNLPDVDGSSPAIQHSTNDQIADSAESRVSIDHSQMTDSVSHAFPHPVDGDITDVAGSVPIF